MFKVSHHILCSTCSVHFSFSKFFTFFRHIPCRTVCISYFRLFFSIFLAMFQIIQCLCLIFDVFQFSCHIPCTPVCISYFPCFSVFLPYSRSHSEHSSFSTFFSVFRYFQITQCAFLIFHVFQVSLHIPGPTMFIFHFPRFSVFRQFPSPTMCNSHFPRFSGFFATFHVLQCSFLILQDFSICSPYSRSYSVHFLFLMSFSFSCHVPDHTVLFLIFHVFQFSRHILGHTVCISHFPRFSVFLAMFHVIQCLCLIFNVFQSSRHILGPTVCISHFQSFSVFFSIYQVLKCPFLLFHVFLFFSPYSRSYSVRFLFLTVFSITRHVPDHTVFVSHFPRFSVLSPYSRY